MNPIPIDETIDGKVKITSRAWIGFFNDIPSIQIGTPAGSLAHGSQGQMMWDANYLYICISPNTWKRTALSSW